MSPYQLRMSPHLVWLYCWYSFSSNVACKKIFRTSDLRVLGVHGSWSSHELTIFWPVFSNKHVPCHLITHNSLAAPQDLQGHQIPHWHPYLLLHRVRWPSTWATDVSGMKIPVHLICSPSQSWHLLGMKGIWHAYLHNIEYADFLAHLENWGQPFYTITRYTHLVLQNRSSLNLKYSIQSKVTRYARYHH